MAFACSAGTVTSFEIGADVSVGKIVIGYPDGNAAEIVPVAPLGAKSAIVLVVVPLRRCPEHYNILLCTKTKPAGHRSSVLLSWNE